MVTRLLTLIFSIFLLIYFEVILYLTPIEPVTFAYIDSPLVVTLLRYLVIPASLTLPWLVLIYVYKDKIANAIEMWMQETRIIPLRYMIFYGVNAVILSIFLVLPLVSIALMLFMAIVVSWWIIISSKFAWKAGRIFLASYAVLVFAVICGSAIFLTLLFYPAYTSVWEWMISNWMLNISVLYTLSILIVNSVTWGTAIWIVELIIRNKPLEEFIDISNWRNRIIEGFIFVFLLIVWINDLRWIVDYFNLISLALVAIIILVKLKLKAVKGNASLIGMATAAVFIVFDLLYRANLIAITLSITVTAIMFYSTILYCLVKAPEELTI
ncbi:MAG: hypothetical protein ACTSPL_06640 [Candidatus Odinarchaeia archaeon]